MRTILATLCLLLWAGSTTAEEPTITAVINGGLICDELTEVTDVLEHNAKPPGCGRLVRPMPATVTLLGPLDVNGQRYMLAKYEFHAAVSWQVQYGFWGPPTAIPSSLDIPA